jgi:hypothetical protein
MSVGILALSTDDQAEVRRWLRVRRLALEHCRAPRRPVWPWLLVLAFLLGYLTGARLHASGEPPVVTLQVRPQVMLQRGDVRAEVRTPRHSENRLLEIAWSSDVGTAGRTMRPLDGEDAPVLQTLDLPGTPAANYLFVATVFNALGKPRGRSEARITVPEGPR